MKSGLEGRNNIRGLLADRLGDASLNEVRPGRPEQWGGFDSGDRAGLLGSQ